MASKIFTSLCFNKSIYFSNVFFWLNKSAMRDRRNSRLDGSNRFLWIIQRTIYRWLRGRLSSLLAPSRGLSRQGNPFRRETRYATRFRKNYVRHLRHSDAGVARGWKFLIRECLSFTTYVWRKNVWKCTWHENWPFSIVIFCCLYKEAVKSIILLPSQGIIRVAA